VTKPLILITNDDGIESPGLSAAAVALDPLGDLLIVAPYRQQSGMGRSLPDGSDHDGRLYETIVRRGALSWPGYAAYASPAQAVQHAILELAARRPALVVSGINFGENVGTGVTISGTVGAAMEGAAYGIPAMAVSLQTDPSLHVHYNDSIDFSTAIHFTRYFAGRWLMSSPLPDVDLLKIEIPEGATADTEWKIARLERQTYYESVPTERKRLQDEGRFGYRRVYQRALSESDTDASLLHDGFVAVTPLSLDMTSRGDWGVLRRALGREKK
jgi:5'/3'-nucleotidase